MRFDAGDRLGPHEILGTLGAGGMGEVYRARDTRLGREVALKVLPAERMADEERRRRFVQEARAASALNHPNIVTIHEIESAGGVDFIVMEYVAGSTLDSVIPKQGMPWKEALRIASPIADALAAAHAKGIVHRDLKPANVAVTREGVVKLLDFGVAKLLCEDVADETGKTSTTMSEAAGQTGPGAIRGTAAYMSPEQATGGKVDARTDIFSFGALLYEMVTGRRAFAGKTVSDTLQAVVRDQPKPPRERVPSIPEALERLILLCLRKEPDRRFQHMSDVKVELQELKDDSGSAAATAAVARGGKRRVAWGVAGLAVLLIVSAGAAWLWRSGAAPLPPARVIPLTALPGAERSPTFSPDGQQIAFSWNGEKADNYDIYVKLTGSSELHRLTSDPAPDWDPAWSPDGRRIAFVRGSSPADWAIHVISPLGGPDRKLSRIPVVNQGSLSWSPDGQWLAAARAGTFQDTTPEPFSIYAFPVEGGEARPLTRARPPGFHVAPALAPNGRRLAYADCITRIPPVACDVYVVELGPDLAPTSPPRRLTKQGFRVLRIAWLPDGRSLVYDTEAGPAFLFLWRVGIDGRRPPERLELAGLGAYLPAISGSRLAFTRQLLDVDVVRFKAGQPPEAFIASTGWDGSSQFSPDGRRLAFESMRSGERMEIWLTGADGKDPVQLTRGPGRWQGAPAWSPDGRRLAFDSQLEDGHWDIWTIDVGGGAPQRLTHDPGNENIPSWSRDGRWVYFSAMRELEGKATIRRIPAAGGVEERVTGLDTNVGGAWESQDGRTLFSCAFGGSPLFAQPLAGGPVRKLLDCVSGRPAYLAAEDVVYYGACGQRPDRELHRFDVATGKDSVVGTLEKWQGSITVSLDGKTILYTSATRSGSDLMLVEGFR